MKIHVTSRFKDSDTGLYHDPGEILTVSEARAERLVAIGAGEVMLELDEPEVLELDEPKPAKRKRRKPRKTKALEPEEDK